MKIAVTGCNGRVGKRVVELALQRGHSVIGIDCRPRQAVAYDTQPLELEFNFVQANLQDYEETKRVLAGAEAVVQLAAFPNPGDYVVNTHNSNVVISWNILRSCAELGINRIAQASSVNVITMAYAEKRVFDYFPIDEEHPSNPDAYGLSKQIAELQAASIVRRYPSMRIASIRLHWSVPHRDLATREDPARRSNDLWGYVQEDSGADAFLLAVTGETGKWSGHEAFLIKAPTVASNLDNKTLRQQFFPNVPIKEGKTLDGKAGFFDCGKAERLLGWVHKDDHFSE